MASGAGGVGMPSEQVEVAKKYMFEQAMMGNWKTVAKVFKENPEARGAKLARSGDTALHLAVSDCQVKIVKKLVDLIPIGDISAASEILNTKNERGNTPLHLAAASGQVEMCEYIAGRDPSLIAARNRESETPLFLAALHGKKEAFLRLHSKCPPENGYSYCRKNDGETILHCAINGEYFDLALQIILLYKDLINFNNEKGLTPLHLLAGKPSAFKSGSRLGLFDSIVYHCIFVDQLKEENYSGKAYSVTSGRENGFKFPENYRTCLNFFGMWKKIVMHFAAVSVQKTDCIKTDTENPKEVNHTPSGGTHKVKGSSGQCNPSNTNDKQGQLKSYKVGLHEFPPNYSTILNFFKVVMKVFLVILGIGITRIRRITEKKEKHTWAQQIMEELVKSASAWGYDDNGRNPNKLESQKEDEKVESDINETTLPMHGISDASDTKTKEDSQNKKEEGKGEAAILVAARMGVVELVEKVLDKFPVAIQDENIDEKNIVLLAVENRQPHVYKLLLNRKILTESVFRKVDKEGNSALHLAATLGDYRPWLIPGAALQMQWEIRWYQFVKDSMPQHFFVRYNNQGKTSKQVFTDTHKQLVKDGGEWLTNTSESCSVVAALIATVAFATASTVPGGVKEGSGAPTLEGEPAFDVFAISSLVALCCSVTSVIMFLSILTSRYQEQDFGSSLPNKLILGLTSLFMSIASMLVSFCAGHFFVLKDKLKFTAFPIYAVTCLPVTFFAAAQFPLYFDLIRSTMRKVPQRSYKVIPN